MTPQRTLAGALVVVALVAAALTPSALADPAGAEYVPAVPKPNRKAADPSSNSSGFAPTETTSPAPATQKRTTQKRKKEPKPEKKRPQKVKTASFETVATGSEASFLPVILLITAGVFLISAAMVMRRRTRETVAFEVPDDERLWPERTTTRPTPEGEIFAGRDQTT